MSRRSVGQGIYAAVLGLALAWTGAGLWSSPAATRTAPHRARPVPTVRAVAWLGATGVVRPPVMTLACPDPTAASSCLITPYGTVGVGPMPTPTPVFAGMAAVNATGSSASGLLWQMPVYPNEWRSVGTTPSRLAALFVPHAAGAKPAAQVQLLRATGPWLVVLAYGPRHRTVGIETVSLVDGASHVLLTLPAGRLKSVTVGSHRVLVDDGFILRVYRLPVAAHQQPSLAILPISQAAAAAQSLVQGFDAAGVDVPGLRHQPPSGPHLVHYTLGTWVLPFEAPRGWMMVPPKSVGPLTIVKLVNPRHAGQWVELREDSTLTLTAAIEGQGASAAMGLPASTGTRIAWISDVALAFSAPASGRRTTVNGVLYPSPTAGTMELEVSLPNREKALATDILDSAGLPY